MPRKNLKKLATLVPLLTTDLVVVPLGEEGEITPSIEAVLTEGPAVTISALQKLDAELEHYMSEAGETFTHPPTTNE